VPASARTSFCCNANGTPSGPLRRALHQGLRQQCMEPPRLSLRSLVRSLLRVPVGRVNLTGHKTIGKGWNNVSTGSYR
jgi:hypothetical protein